MKIGVIGPAKRTVAWEQHLAGHPSVSEVIIAADLQKAGGVDACLLLNEHLEEALAAIKQGVHTFVISKLPIDAAEIGKLHHASEEANVRLLFSHWPTLAPGSRWIAMKIPKPSFIQVVREVNYTALLESDITHRSLLIDELGYCLKYIGGLVHQTSYNSSVLNDQPSVSHALLKFDSGATAAIFINSAADRNNHTRYVSGANLLIECEVESQRVRMGRKVDSGHLFFDRKEFDPSKAAEQAVVKFLKAIQLKKPTLYNGYDLLHLSKILEKMELKQRL